MSGARTKAIIAIFGGNDDDAVNRAKALGGLLAKRFHILLTGGTKPGSQSVKESAIAGVGPSSWIGVERADRIDTAKPGNGFIIYTDLGHKRNYLEACLCDAAIGLSGGDGTVSEVTFSLALQRPVVFVGDDWKRDGSLDDSGRATVLKSMVSRTFNRVGRTPSGKPDFDALVNESVIQQALTQLPPYIYLDSSKSSEDAVNWIEDILKTRKKAGHFPILEDYKPVISEFDAWLSTHAI